MMYIEVHYCVSKLWCMSITVHGKYNKPNAVIMFTKLFTTSSANVLRLVPA